MRKTPATESVVLFLLRQTSPTWGLEICRQLDLKPGTVYPILSRLEASDWLVAAWEDLENTARGARRRYYSLSEFGRSEAENYMSREKLLRLRANAKTASH